jgi:hypothetical protein
MPRLCRGGIEGLSWGLARTCTREHAAQVSSTEIVRSFSSYG